MKEMRWRDMQNFAEIKHRLATTFRYMKISWDLGRVREEGGGTRGRTRRSLWWVMANEGTPKCHRASLACVSVEKTM